MADSESEVQARFGWSNGNGISEGRRHNGAPEFERKGSQREANFKEGGSGLELRIAP